MPLVGSASWSYDAAGRMTGNVQRGPGGQAVASFIYGSDAANRLTSESGPDVNTSYSYDSANQLTAGAGVAYSYDAAGNRNMTGVVTGPQNRLEQDSSGSFQRGQLNATHDGIVGTPTRSQSRQLDAVGNVLSQSDANGHSTSSSYDPLNRQVTQTDALVAP